MILEYHVVVHSVLHGIQLDNLALLRGILQTTYGKFWRHYCLNFPRNMGKFFLQNVNMIVTIKNLFEFSIYSICVSLREEELCVLGNTSDYASHK